MVTISISNTPVSEQLGNNASVTVPSGDMWRVSISIAADNMGSATKANVLVNNTRVMELSGGDTDSGGWIRGYTIETVLSGSDTVSTDGNAEATITGWEVSNDIENTVVSEQLGTDESTTVPSNETWSVYIAHGGESSGGDLTDIQINGVKALSIVGGSDNNGATERLYGGRYVLTSGDTVSTNSRARCHIGGWIV